MLFFFPFFFSSFHPVTQVSLTAESLVAIGSGHVVVTLAVRQSAGHCGCGCDDCDCDDCDGCEDGEGCAGCDGCEDCKCKDMKDMKDKEEKKDKDMEEEEEEEEEEEAAEPVTIAVLSAAHPSAPLDLVLEAFTEATLSLAVVNTNGKKGANDEKAAIAHFAGYTITAPEDEMNEDDEEQQGKNIMDLINAMKNAKGEEGEEEEEEEEEENASKKQKKDKKSVLEMLTSAELEEDEEDDDEFVPQEGEEEDAEDHIIRDDKGKEIKLKDAMKEEEEEEEEEEVEKKEEVVEKKEEPKSKKEARKEKKEKAEKAAKEEVKVQESPKPVEKRKREETPAKSPKPKSDETNEKKAMLSIANEVVKSKNGMQYQDIVIGTGKAPTPGRRVSVKYVGKLTNGKIFDQTKGNPFSFRLGVGEVIKGWDIGVSSMKEGGKRRLVIPPQFAYGSRGAPPQIPGNATLVFEVELVKCF